MSITLNSELLVRDIKKFSAKNSMPEDKTSKKHNTFLSLIKSLSKIFIANMQLDIAYSRVKSKIKSDYKKFVQADDRSKEDILINWENLSNDLKKHINKKPTTVNFATKGIIKKCMNIINTVSGFVEHLNEELYPNQNQPLSQEYLKEFSKKFEHLPKDVLEDLTTEPYSECQ